MTLMEFLRTLPADPTDPSSPRLIVGEGMLTPDQREEVTSNAYGRRPYAVVVGLPRAVTRRLHNHAVRSTGGLDVHFNHARPLIGPLPDGDALAHLQALLVRAPDSVTEIRPGYPLAARLALGTEIDPRPTTFDTFDGLTATTRLIYAIWR